MADGPTPEEPLGPTEDLDNTRPHIETGPKPAVRKTHGWYWLAVGLTVLLIGLLVYILAPETNPAAKFNAQQDVAIASAQAQDTGDAYEHFQQLAAKEATAPVTIDLLDPVEVLGDLTPEQEEITPDTPPRRIPSSHHTGDQHPRGRRSQI